MADKDLFDDSTMTFGEHLEVLRVHLWKAIIGLLIGTIAAFYFSNHVIVALQRPVTKAMAGPASIRWICPRPQSTSP